MFNSIRDPEDVEKIAESIRALHEIESDLRDYGWRTTDPEIHSEENAPKARMEAAPEWALDPIPDVHSIVSSSQRTAELEGQDPGWRISIGVEYNPDEDRAVLRSEDTKLITPCGNLDTTTEEWIKDLADLSGPTYHESTYGSSTEMVQDAFGSRVIEKIESITNGSSELPDYVEEVTEDAVKARYYPTRGRVAAIVPGARLTNDASEAIQHQEYEFDVIVE